MLFARGGERQFKEPYHVLRQLLQPVLSNLKPDVFRQVMGTWEEVVGPAMGLKQPKAGARRLDRRACATASTTSSPSWHRAAHRW